MEATIIKVQEVFHTNGEYEKKSIYKTVRLEEKVSHSEIDKHINSELNKIMGLMPK